VEVQWRAGRGRISPSAWECLDKLRSTPAEATRPLESWITDMRLALFDPEHPDLSLSNELRSIFREVESYRKPKLPENVESRIQSTAANPVVVDFVISKITKELYKSQRKMFVIAATSLGGCCCSLLVKGLAQYFVSYKLYHDLISPACWVGVILFLESFFLRYFDWRKEYRDSYVGSYLIRALEFGLMYESAQTDERLRDCLATSIQRAAYRYRLSYKKSGSTFYFSTLVRKRAKICRSHIISIIPVLVTADLQKIENINSDIARLIIRTQTGYWYQTDDIVRDGTAVPRRESILISISTFFKDRSVQVAFIAFTATVLAGVAAIIARKF
jgi:hypothetical protein